MTSIESRVEIAFGHLCHVKLVEKLALVTLFAEASGKGYQVCQ